MGRHRLRWQGTTAATIRPPHKSMKTLEGGTRGGFVRVGSQIDLSTTGPCLPGVPLWKRILDVSLIVMAAPMWLPVMLGISAGIKCLSPGPVLFRQERIGLRGKRFVCLKFRTMHTGAKTVAHEKHLAELMKSDRPMTKLDGHDPRLIPLARMLRSTGLDELPQLFNVLLGEMSLVGPRPSTPSEFDAYTPQQRARTNMLPGLTGLWQVSGKNRTTFNEMIELDIRYLKTQCLWLDLGIMLRTPIALQAQVCETLLPGKIQDSPAGWNISIQSRESKDLAAGSALLREQVALMTTSLGNPDRPPSKSIRHQRDRALQQAREQRSPEIPSHSVG
jgi:lipopolysaccharide/colanic/teichoic acid biosynthesis glycosyltransferase